MQVSKWGNSLAVRLPAAVVEALGLKDGDQVEVQVAGKRAFQCPPRKLRFRARMGNCFLKRADDGSSPAAIDRDPRRVDPAD